MISLVYSLFLMTIEIWGNLYFYDTFLINKGSKKLQKYRFFIWFCLLTIWAFAGKLIGWWRVIPMIISYVLLSMLFYNITFLQSFFLTISNYCIMFIFDYLSFLPFTHKISQYENDAERDFWYCLLALVSKMLWIVLLLIIRKIRRQKEEDYPLTNKEWLQLSVIAIITLSAMFAMFFTYTNDESVQKIYLLMAVGMVVINLVVIHIMQEILEKEKALRISTLAYQNQKKQLAAYEDGNKVYEQQRKKMHDYKNQIATIQTLIKGEDYRSALTFTENLTESISVDMSAINTNHPVVNAVLNQKYRSAKEKNISMS